MDVGLRGKLLRSLTTWYVVRSMWYVARSMWYVACGMWHMALPYLKERTNKRNGQNHSQKKKPFKTIRQPLSYAHRPFPKMLYAYRAELSHVSSMQAQKNDIVDGLGVKC